MLLNNEWVKHEIKEQIRKFRETHENELTTVQNLWDTVKAVLKGKFIGIKPYLKKIETFQINNLTLYLQKLDEKTTKKPRASRRKEITKIRAELNDIETICKKYIYTNTHYLVYSLEFYSCRQISQ